MYIVQTEKRETHTEIEMREMNKKEEKNNKEFILDAKCVHSISTSLSLRHGTLAQCRKVFRRDWENYKKNCTYERPLTSFAFSLSPPLSLSLFLRFSRRCFYFMFTLALDHRLQRQPRIKKNERKDAHVVVATTTMQKAVLRTRTNKIFTMRSTEMKISHGKWRIQNKPN